MGLTYTCLPSKSTCELCQEVYKEDRFGDEEVNLISLIVRRLIPEAKRRGLLMESLTLSETRRLHVRSVCKRNYIYIYIFA